MKTITHKIIFPAIIGIVAILIATAAFLFFGVNRTHANPIVFGNAARTATATTTRAYLGTGTATSTLTYDTYGLSGSNQAGVGQTIATVRGTLLVQLDASSTASVLNITPEYSDDGIDWYQNNLQINATTSSAHYIQTPDTLSWTYASSTVGGAGILGSTASTSKAIVIDTPLRFVRFVFSMTGARGAIWATFVPIKELHE